MLLTNYANYLCALLNEKFNKNANEFGWDYKLNNNIIKQYNIKQ